MRIPLLIFFVVATNLASAAPHSLSDLQRLDSRSPLAAVGKMQTELPDDSAIKMAAMRDAALATGAQHGYAGRMEVLKTEIDYQGDALDGLYDFGALMRLTAQGDSELYLLPPVIEAAENVMATDSAQRRIRISNQLFVITEPARLVTRPPDWREFLVFDSPRPLSIPDKVLLPKTQEEQRYWAAWVAEGWEAGSIQADQEMTSRVRNLANTYIGMARYARMNLEQKVDAPNVTSITQNVTGNDNEMRLDDRVYELTEDARMNLDSERWKAIPTDSRDSLLTPDEAEIINAPSVVRRERLGEREDDYLMIFGSGVEN